MRRKRKRRQQRMTGKIAAALVITSVMLMPSAGITALPAKVIAAAPPTTSHILIDSLYAEVKSVLNEQTSEGTRIGIVVSITNMGDRISGLPESELRVRTADGVEYTLRPSADNTDAVLPKEKMDFSYMVVVNRKEPFTLSELSWVEVNASVYPKREQTLLTLPIAALEWKGSQSTVVPEAPKAWGESFTIATQSSSLEYKPIALSRQRTDKGAADVVTLLVENKGTLKQTVPDFRIDGKAGNKIVHGERLGGSAIELEPGDRQYVHYAIPVDVRERIGSLNVLTTETFKADSSAKDVIEYTVGRVSISVTQDAYSGIGAAAYTMGKAIAIDPLSKLFPARVALSLEELRIHEGEGDLYKTIVAKYMIRNESDSPVMIPKFGAELKIADGISYLGTRQNMSIQTLIPNLNYVFYYEFVVPSTEMGSRLVMNLVDEESAAPYRVPVAALQTGVQETTEDADISLYPFKIKVKDKKIAVELEPTEWIYTNKLTLDLDMTQTKSVVDQNFSKLLVEVTDKDNRLLAAEAYSLTGAERISRGEQTITFKTREYERQYTIRFYEMVDTPFGEAKRLLKTLSH
ncbi:hypothetical protein ACFFK0_29015 [Paenibacillus chartarius]|uniref:Uncharacterized protein n=1 Tax=Paenibacillus chartarius TaxID=747481 RepID=A0ABV6DUW3_9BACL